MRRWWYQLNPFQKKVFAFFIVLIILEVVIWGTICIGRGLQNVFYWRWRHMITQVYDIQGLPYASLINTYGRQYEIDPALIAAVIRCESSFNPRARSKADALGLMQISLPTWQELKRTELGWQKYTGISEDTEALFDPQINISAGTKYLHMMLNRYHGDAAKGIAAYNAGPGSVDRYGGIPPYSETIRYVDHVAETWIAYRGAKDLTVVLYRSGYRLEKSGLHIQQYLIVGVAGILLTYILKQLYRASKRRW